MDYKERITINNIAIPYKLTTSFIGNNAIDFHFYYSHKIWNNRGFRIVSTGNNNPDFDAMKTAALNMFSDVIINDIKKGWIIQDKETK